MIFLRFCLDLVKLFIAFLTVTGTLLFYLLEFAVSLFMVTLGLTIFVVFALFLAFLGQSIWGGPFWAWAAGCILLSVAFALGSVNAKSGSEGPGEDR
ncbi:hypothetical protein SY88_02165 [Clostridiales bacterium PH28_bin88]|nr:hypothetical protein SY88_02165 [Clostridiales bacterium PH28_bin88]